MVKSFPGLFSMPGKGADTMTMRVLLVQREDQSINVLSHHLVERGDEVWHTKHIDEGLALLDLVNPHLLILDIHYPGNEWLELLRQARRINPDLKVIITSKTPDLQREFLVKNEGVKVFLRQPFEKRWFERALSQVENKAFPAARAGVLQNVKIPVAIKLFFPYFLLFVLIMLAAGFLSFRYIKDNAQNSIQAGILRQKNALQNLLLKEEQSLYLTASLLAKYEGLPEALQQGQTQNLRVLLENKLPQGDYESIEILNPYGDSILSLRKFPWREPVQFEIAAGETFFRDVDFIKLLLFQRSVEPDMTLSGLVKAPWGDFYYVGIPVFHEGTFQGILLAGKSLVSIHSQFETAIGSDINFYDITGRSILSAAPVGISNLTMPYSQVKNVIAGSVEGNQARKIFIGETEHIELFVPWQVSSGEDLGLLGILMPYSPTLTLMDPYPVWIMLVFSVGAAAIFIVAALFARRLNQTVEAYGLAAKEIGQGNLQTKLKGERGDELDNLARHMNAMVSGIQERLLEHDLFGVSYAFEPQTPFNANAIQQLYLEGREINLTGLHIQPVGFRKMIAEFGPKKVFETLNAFYQAAAEVTIGFGGVVTHFNGEAVSIYFGLFAHAEDQVQSALKACRASAKVRDILPNFNLDQQEKGLPSLQIMMVVESSLRAAGVLQVKDRLHYAVTASGPDPLQCMKILLPEPDENRILVSASTLALLAEHRYEFEFTPLDFKEEEAAAQFLDFYRMH
jgi:CheY-like chemotaxis protein/class 3 adenylate cyclase